MLKGAVLGGLFGLAVGIGFAGALLPLTFGTVHPMDRWYIARLVSALVVVSCVSVGLIAGVASRTSDDGLPLLRSVIVVSVGGILGVMALIITAGGWVWWVPLCGAILGGVAVALAGESKRRGRARFPR
jgi:hypothetical protein